MPRDFSQSSSQFLAAIDGEIERLQQLRQQVSAANDADKSITTPRKSKRKSMSEEGRRRIAQAQKARWAKQKAAPKARRKKAIIKKSSSVKGTAKKAAARTAEQA